MFGLGFFIGALCAGGVGVALTWAIVRARAAGDIDRIRRSSTAEEHMAQILCAEARASHAAAAARLDESAQRVAQLVADSQEHARALDTAHAVAADHGAALARAETQLASERRAFDERLATERRASEEKLALAQRIVRDAEKALREAFASLSSDALRRNNQSFIDLAKETLGGYQQQATGELEKRQQAIDEMVKPIRETLDKFDTKISDVEKARIESYASLGEQVKSLSETQQHLHSETSNLVKALRAPNVRGRWGEIQLKRVVELAGMIEHCDFSEQQTTTSEDGRIRPDLIVRLPGNRTVVVDAKTPLDAYMSAHEATDDAARIEHLRRHARQVRDHIGKLSDKQYWSQFEQSPDFVLMFLPGETFFSAALEHDPSLIEYGLERRVILSSPTTLITHLRSAAYGWRQEQIEQSAQAISALGRSLYDRLQIMAGHFDDMRRHLDRTVDAYNRTAASLETRVMVSARRFGELGVTTQADIPEVALIDRTARAMQSLPLLDAPDADVPENIDAPPEFLTADVS